MRSALKLKLVGLALALAVSASLVAVASRDSGAYFVDVHMGKMTGTLGSAPATCPYRLEPGTSKARHWDLKASQPARVLPIAQHDSSGALYLDFGEEEPGNSNASPDVFRLVSLVADARAISFSVSGAMAAFVSEVRLKDRGSVLPGGATESVYVKIGVSGDAQPGTYAGRLTVHVDGWTPDAQLPMTITVRGAAATSAPAVRPAATAAPAAAPSAGPSTTPGATPAATPDPTLSPATSETPAAMLPTATPTPVDSASAGASGV